MGRVLLCQGLPCLLVSTPFCLVTGKNPALTGVRVFLAVGLVTGCLIPLRMDGRLGRRVIGLVCLVSLVLGVLPEWLLVPCDVIGERSQGIFALEWYYAFRNVGIYVQPLLMFAASACCALMVRGVIQDSDDSENIPPPISSDSPMRFLDGVATGYLASFVPYVTFAAASQQPYDVRLLLGAEALPLFVCLLAWNAPLAGDSGDTIVVQDAAVTSSLWGLSLGLVMWVALLRVVPLGNLRSWLYVACAVAAACWTLIRLIRAHVAIEWSSLVRSSESDSICSAPISNARRSVEDALSVYGLAPRELEVACLSLMDLSSSDVAQRLGIQPSTVRATMQRVYRKAHVANLAALQQATKPGIYQRPPSIGTDGARCVHEDELPAGGTLWHNTLLALAAACCSVLLLPIGISQLPWGSWRPFVYGCALALLLLAPMPMWAQGRRWQERDALSIVRCVCLGMGFTTLFLAAWCGVRAGLMSGPVALMLAFVGTLLVGIPCFEDLLSHVDVTHVRHIDVPLRAMLPSLSLFLGLAWEELWRGAAWYSIVPELVVFELLCVGGLALIVSDQYRHRAILLAVMVLVALIARLRVTLFVDALCTLIWLLREGFRAHALDARVVTAVIALCAVGILGGDFLVDLLGFYLVGNDVLTAPFGGRAAFGAIVSSLGYVLSSLYGLLCIAACLRTQRNAQVLELLGEQPSSEERLRYTLRGRGLTHTQEDVVLGILRGQTSAQIGLALHYSRGTVNTARAAAYKRLDVHSRSELIATLHQLSGL